MELPAIPTVTEATEHKPAAPLPLPPAPDHFTTARHLAPHELRDAVATIEGWLRHADATALTSRLSKSQLAEVELQQLRLRELRR